MAFIRISNEYQIASSQASSNTPRKAAANIIQRRSAYYRGIGTIWNNRADGIFSVQCQSSGSKHTLHTISGAIHIRREGEEMANSQEGNKYTWSNIFDTPIQRRDLLP